MGGNFSDLKREDMEEIMQKTNFSEAELRRLFRHFKTLCDEQKAGNEALFDKNPLLSRFLSLFATSRGAEVQFCEFVSVLAALSDKEAAETKLRFAFRVFDIDGDGYISNGELFQVYRAISRGCLTDEQVQQVVDRTIIETDSTKEGKVSFSDFAKSVGVSGVGEHLTINWQ